MTNHPNRAQRHIVMQGARRVMVCFTATAAEDEIMDDIRLRQSRGEAPERSDYTILTEERPSSSNRATDLASDGRPYLTEEG